MRRKHLAHITLRLEPFDTFRSSGKVLFNLHVVTSFKDKLQRCLTEVKVQY